MIKDLILYRGMGVINFGAAYKIITPIMKNALILVIVTLFTFVSCFAQSISDREMKSVQNPERLAYKYKGKLIGCNFDLTCYGFQVDFTNITYDPKSNNLAFSGSVFFGSVNRPVSNVSIFIAKPSNDNLKNLKSLYRTSEKSNIKEFPFGMGDFNIISKIREGDRLYFCHNSFYLVEFDVSRLIRSKGYSTSR